MTQQTEKLTSNAARDIPTPPGGGSWTFDEAAWQWKPNDAAPEQVPATTGVDTANTLTEQE
jgi:hypothetical protein